MPSLIVTNRNIAAGNPKLPQSDTQIRPQVITPLVT